MATAGTDQSAPERPTGLRLVLITMALLLAPLIQVFDTSILSIALRQMQGSLSATQDQVAWVLTSYLIAMAVMTPLWGALGAMLGRKNILLVTIAGFLVFSIFAGNSTTLEEMLFYRFLQGAFGAALIPVGLASMLAIYPREDIGIAMGWWGIGIMFGPVFGPTLGGYLTEYYSWRWAFYINIPICLLAFTMIAILVPRSGNRQTRKFNFFGFIMLAVGIGALQFVLDRGQRLEWFTSPLIITLCLISASALWVFVVNSLTSKTPFLDPVIFADKNYVSGIVLRILFGIMLFGTLVLVPPFLQNQGGYSLLDSGWIMAPRGLGTMFASLIVGRLIKFVDPRRVIVFGMLVTAYTVWEFSRFTEDIVLARVIVINVFQGIGFACFVIPVNSVAFSTLPEQQRDVGTAFYALLNNIGRGIGIAILANFLAGQTQVSQAILSAHISPFNDYVRHIGLPAAIDINEAGGRAVLNRVVSQQAELMAYIADFQLLAILILCCVPVVFLMNKPARRSSG